MSGAGSLGGRAVVVRRAGGFGRLRVEDVDVPPPGPGEVRIAVAAVGVNFADVIVRMGLYATAREEVGWPITPGFEVAGTVDAVGDGVTTHAPGDAVIAVTFFGGYATRVVVPAAQAFRRPAGLDDAAAGGLLVPSLTAFYALHELGHARAGETALVHSAAGGVGGMLVQMGRLAGCRVVGVVGATHKVAYVEALGADAVVDKSSERLWDAVDRAAPDGLDLVFDANGVETLQRGYDRLAPGGRLLVYGAHSMFPRGRGTPRWLRLAWDVVRTPRFSALDMAGHNKGVAGFNLSRMFGKTEMLARAMARITGWVEAGELRVAEVTTFPFDGVADAHRALQSGDTRGRVVLVVG